jgi:two-component system sensor histidine kinase/response regulator
VVRTNEMEDSSLLTSVLERELPASRESSEEREKVLVIDDEEGVIRALSDFLSARGFDVMTAINCRQALGLVHDDRFSAVISDLRLPDMSGVELLEHVLDVDPDTVFIIMTGYASVQSAVDAMKKGAYDYVVKPFSMYEIEKTVRLGLEKRKLARQNVELSHLMRKLIEIDQIKSNIISTVSHEFRTPLMSLKGYLAMLQKGCAKGDTIGDGERMWLKAMKDNVERLDVLILNLLLMTEANTGGLIIAEEQIDLATILADSIERTGTLCRAKEVSVDFDPNGNGGMTGDAEKLALAFTNLLENAIKFNLESGRVDVGLLPTSKPDGARVTILDTGIGIPEEKIPTIFDSFTQVDMTHTRRFAGAGLGLPVAKAIVEAHGGTIDVHSEPGRGTTFHVWLPKRNGVQHGT